MAKKLTYYVYVHTNKINDKKYIGITCQKPEARWGVGGSRYLYRDIRYNSVFAAAIRKYGWENFTHEILFEGLTEAEAKVKEKELIAYYRTYIGFENCKGYNMTLGGDGAALYKTDEERQAAIKASRKKCRDKLNESEEYREKQRRDAAARQRQKWQDPEWADAKKAYQRDYYQKNKEKYKSYSSYTGKSSQYYNTYIKDNQEAKDARNAQRNERRAKIREIRKQLFAQLKLDSSVFTAEEQALILEKYPGTNSYKCEHLPKLSKLLEKVQKSCI